MLGDFYLPLTNNTTSKIWMQYIRKQNTLCGLIIFQQTSYDTWQSQ